MARRTHTKSRRGCLTCKRRHIKCDEQHPTCSNCRISQRECAYGERHRSPSSHSHRSATTAVTSATSPSTPGFVPTPCSPPETSPNVSIFDALGAENQFQTFVPRQEHNGCGYLAVPLPESSHVSADDLTVNMRHMQYLSHFLLVTCNSVGLSLPSLGEAKVTSCAMAAALRYPPLLHSMLALAALHLGHRTDAAALQSQALELFNATPQALDVTPESAVPTLLFSSLVGIQMLAEVSLSCYDPSIDDAVLLDRFIEYVDVHRGVRAVIGASWSSLTQSGLKSIMTPFQQDIECFEQRRHGGEGEGECVQLQQLLQHLQSSGLPADALRSYGDAIQHLEWAFDLESRLPRDQSAPSPAAVFAWPIMLSIDFVALVQQRRPEALIILAHYGALLHRHRELWVVGNLGTRVVGAITTLLGRYWRPWLEWPNAVLTEQGQ